MIVFLALAAIAIGTVFHFFNTYAYSYWSRKGFPYTPPSFLFGNLHEVMTRKVSFGIHMYDLYKQSAEPLLTGIYFFFRPALLIKDATLARRILVQDFASFHDRGTFHNPSVDPMSGHMFNKPGLEWKQLRAQLTPTFTTGKLKSMMSTILVEGENLKRHLQASAQKREVVKMKELLDKYSLNIIASVGFGLDIDTHDNPDHEFIKVEQVINGPGLIQSLRLLFAFLCPNVLYFFNTYANSDIAKNYFIDMVKDTFEYREKNNIVRKDFMQLLMQLRNSGKVSEDNDWDVRKTDKVANSTNSMSIVDCAAQSYLFYLAGFDTSSSALTYCLYELVQNPELMQKVQRDIDEALERHNNEITYESIMDMKYLELCILETVRKYPTLPLLNRICTKDYQVPDTNLTIPKGTPIIISLMGIGRDAKYFPEPDRFWPERFAADVMQYQEDAFIPFGEGPRMCIGLRLGKMVAKVGLVQMIRSYNFESVQTGEIQFHNFSVTMIPKGGVEIRVVNRVDA